MQYLMSICNIVSLNTMIYCQLLGGGEQGYCIAKNSHLASTSLTGHLNLVGIGRDIKI